MFNVIVLLGIIFFGIDIAYYKPPDFSKHTLSTFLLLCHHFIAIYIIIGIISTFIKPNQTFILFFIFLVIHWQLLDNKCIISILTQKLGPKYDIYPPFVGIFDMLNINKLSDTINLYFAKQNLAKQNLAKQNLGTSKILL